MASEIKGEIEMNLAQANATIRAQEVELKKLRTALKGTQVDADKAGDSLNKQARRARSDLAVFGAQGRLIGQAAQGLTSLVGPIGVVGGAVMAAGYAWEKFDEHMKSVIARSVEMGATQREINRSMNEDAAKLAEKRLAGTEERAKLQTLYPGQDAEALVSGTVKASGIEEEIIRRVLIAVGPKAKKMSASDRAIYLDKVLGVFRIANIGGGVPAEDIIKDLGKTKAIGDIGTRAARITSESSGTRITKNEVVDAWVKNSQLLENQAKAKLARDKEEIESRNKQKDAIKANIDALEPSKQLEFYRENVPGFKKTEKEIRDKSEAAKKSADARRKMLEETTFGFLEEGPVKSFGEFGSRASEFFTVGWKSAWASMAPDTGKALVKARGELQETAGAAARQIGIPEDKLMRLINATEATATAITTEMKR